MSLLCPYEGCNRTFPRHQSLSQHIRKSHTIVKNNKINDEINSNADFFQDEELFENLNLFKVSFEIKSIC